MFELEDFSGFSNLSEISFAAESSFCSAFAIRINKRTAETTMGMFKYNMGTFKYNMGTFKYNMGTFKYNMTGRGFAQIVI